MKELFQTLLTTSKDRISNPIIGSFILSWLAFNWRPILFIFCSDMKVEDKIKYIDSNFHSVNNLLIFPLIIVVVYYLLIPYIVLLFDYALEFSSKKRNVISISSQKRLIENKKELAIEEIKLEEAQADYKERKNHNKLVEDLQKIIQDKDDQLVLERERFTNLNGKIKDESLFLNKRFEEDKREFENKIDLLVRENKVLREKLFERERSHELTEYDKMISEKERLEMLSRVDKSRLMNKDKLK